MDEEIEASPTSQRKRKKLSSRRSIKNMSTTGGDNLKLVVNDQNIRDTTEDSDCSFRNKMWQSAYLLEEHDRVDFAPKNGRHRSVRNEFRLSRPADFLSVSQLCATRAPNPSAEEESQWNVTESQFRRVDDAIKEYVSEMECKRIGGSNSVPANEDIVVVPNVSDDKICDIAHNDESAGSANDRHNSLKRRSSVLESILSEWSSSSPVKIHKTQGDVMQLSPTFKFNRKRSKRTYGQKQGSYKRSKLVNDSKEASPAATSIYRETAVENILPELCRKPNHPATVKDDDEDFDGSMNIVDNIQNLSNFFSQSCDTSVAGDQADATNSSNVKLTESKTSLDDEPEFLGFDAKDLSGGPVSITLPEFFLKCDRKLSPLASVTIPERYYQFDSDSDCSHTPAHSPTATTDHLLLMEDDDLFANYQTQQHVCREEIRFEKAATTTSAAAAVATALNDDAVHINVANGTRCSGNNSVQMQTHTETATKVTGRRANIFQDIEEEFNVMSNLRQCPSTEPPLTTGSFSSFSRLQWGGEMEQHPNAMFAGFSTVSGKKIPVSSALISKKMGIFENATVGEDELKKVGNWIGDGHLTDKANSSSGIKQVNFDLATAFTGFKTAAGNRIPVSSELILKKTNIFDSVNVTEDELKPMDWFDDELLNDDDFGLNPKPSFAGFATVRGKQIPVSSTMLSKNKNIFETVTVTDNDLNGIDTWISDSDGMHETNDLFGMERNNFAPNAALIGFTTAGGKHVPMPSPQISKRISIFDDMDVSANENMNHYIGDVGSSNSIASATDGARKMPISRSLFPRLVQNVVSDNHTKQWNSTDLFREVTNTPQKEADNGPKKLPLDTFIKPSPMRKMSMLNSLRKTEALKENVDAKPNILSVDESLSIHNGMSDRATSTPTSSRSHVCVTPTNNSSLSQIGRESAAAIIEDDELTFANRGVESKEQTPGFASGFMAEITSSLSSTPINKVDNQRNRLKQRRLVEKFDDIAREGNVETNIQPGTIKITLPLHIKSSRSLAIEEQQRSITKKTNVKPVPSSLFVSKLTSTQVNWKEFVQHCRPVNKPIIGTNLTSNILNVTACNATKFQFNAFDHYTDEFCRENTDGIHLQDDIVVMMDENCQVGLTEISAAFLSCPSVDPKLMHDKWIENHMKWIVVKLAAMERSFPHRFAGKALTLEHLMLQLKYRYEREIDRAERSAIRKICEMDDVPEKRMILFVAGITKSSSEYNVELSDGWYSLMSTLDVGMNRLINEGKIKVGTKLVIQGANTINLTDGCHPLDVSTNVKLRIHANSTRRAKWDSKLGYCKNPEPFKISLRYVWGNGGVIAKLRVCVLRVYPVVFIDPKNLSDVHSERVERRRSINDERVKSIAFEKVMNDISRDIEEEEKSARCQNRDRKMVKLAEISSITDPAYLCELLDNDKDPERIEGELTNTQKTMILSYKEKVECLRNEEINTRVKERLAAMDKGQRKFVPLLRFKMTDEMLFDKTALVTVWKPSEEILSLIKERTVFDLTGSSARGAGFSELKIYAGKNAVFRKLDVATRVPESLLRRHYNISEILSIEQLFVNELDTTGFVIHVGESLHSFQPVYIADSDHNILCINFWRSVKEFAYEDVVQPKRFLAIRHLQWRKSSSSIKPIPCAYTTENSMFTENPQSIELSKTITTLKEKFVNVDLDAFIDACMEKVRASNSASACQSTSIPSNLSSPLLQSSASSLPKTPTDLSQRPKGRSSLSNQSRIDQLNKYGDGMPTPPLKIDCLNKSFKLPVNNS